MVEDKEYFQSEVDADEAGQRVDQWLASKLIDVSRSQIKKWITDGHILINGSPVIKSSQKVKVGELIEASASKPTTGKLIPADIGIDVLYEDDSLIVVNKAAGVVVHPGAGTKEPTLVEGILYHVGKITGGEDFRPGVVHRLDKDTSGVMVVAKNEIAHRKLADQFAEKTNEREYVVILDGHVSKEETNVESYLHRDPEHRLRFTFMETDEFRMRFGESAQGYRWAKSHFTRKLDFAGRLTLCFVKLHTGRTHQIRVHAKQLGAPVLGDQLYNNETTLPSTFSPEVIKKVKSIKRQMLHARVLGFIHPVSNEFMRFEAPLPEDFKTIIADLKPYAAG